MTAKLFACYTVLFLVSCSETPETVQTLYRPVLDVRQLMEWILDPAADVIWDSAGSIITAQGEQDLSPTTEEGWLEVRRQAGLLAESGNLLMLAGRSRGADWDEYSLGLVDASKLAMEAARQRNSDALFDAGGRIYQVCLACHSQYLIQADASRP